MLQAGHFDPALGVRGSFGSGIQDHRQDRQEACNAGGSEHWLRPHFSAQEVAAETKHQNSGAQKEPGRNVPAVQERIPYEACYLICERVGPAHCGGAAGADGQPPTASGLDSHPQPVVWNFWVGKTSKKELDTGSEGLRSRTQA
jgi:hypothetical protein